MLACSLQNDTTQKLVPVLVTFPVEKYDYVRMQIIARFLKTPFHI